MKKKKLNINQEFVLLAKDKIVNVNLSDNLSSFAK